MSDEPTEWTWSISQKAVVDMGDWLLRLELAAKDRLGSDIYCSSVYAWVGQVVFKWRVEDPRRRWQ